MPANVSPEYAQAEKKFLEAQTDEDRLFYLEDMVKNAPAHKGGEALRANLRTRYKKLKEKLENRKKSGGGSKQGIKKEDLQIVIAGFPNTGKSSLFKALTKQETIISNIGFSTCEPILGTTRYDDVQIQTIDMPPFPNEDKSTINTTDIIIITINSLDQIQESEKYLEKTRAKKIFVLTKVDSLTDSEKRKLQATLNSKYKNKNPLLFSNKKHTQQEIENLKKKIYSFFPVIRIYTKEPKKEASKNPMIMKEGSQIKDMAEKILKGMSKKIKRAKIWGPSSKFPGQTVGIEHVLKDKDVIELQTE